MENKRKNHSQADKIVVVRLERTTMEEKKNLFFLFTAYQVEEVLLDITVSPLPFAPHFLLGICSWRGQVVPIVDIEERCGFPATDSVAKDRFIVVRTGVLNTSAENKILHCVLRVSAEIHTVDVSDSISLVGTDELGLNSALLRGAYQQGKNIYIVPDLASILQNQQSIDINSRVIDQ